MKKINAIIVALLMLVGCGTYRQMPIESAKDSVSIVVKESVVYRDSIVYVEVPAESESVILADTDTSRLETSLAQSEAWVSDGRLNHTLRHKPDVRLPKIVTIPVYLRSEETKSLAERVIIKEVEKDLNAWQSFRIVLGTLLLVIVFVWGAIKVCCRFV